MLSDLGSSNGTFINDKKLTPGDTVNLETDLLAKYVERQLSGQAADAPQG